MATTIAAKVLNRLSNRRISASPIIVNLSKLVSWLAQMLLHHTWRDFSCINIRRKSLSRIRRCIQPDGHMRGDLLRVGLVSADARAAVAVIIDAWVKLVRKA